MDELQLQVRVLGLVGLIVSFYWRKDPVNFVLPLHLPKNIAKRLHLVVFFTLLSMQP